MRVVKLSNDSYQIRFKEKKRYIVIETFMNQYDTKEEAFKILNGYKKTFLEEHDKLYATVVEEVEEFEKGEEKEEVFLCPHCKEIINKNAVVCKYCSKQIYT